MSARWLLKKVVASDMKLATTFFKNRQPAAGACRFLTNNLVMLISSARPLIFDGSATATLQDCLRSKHLQAGISNRFDHISQMPEAYRQALVALDSAVPDHLTYRRAHIHSTAGITYLISLTRRERSKVFWHPAIK